MQILTFLDGAGAPSGIRRTVLEQCRNGTDISGTEKLGPRELSGSGGGDMPQCSAARRSDRVTIAVPIAETFGATPSDRTPSDHRVFRVEGACIETRLLGV
jgi:hypothetical protein